MESLEGGGVTKEIPFIYVPGSENLELWLNKMQSRFLPQQPDKLMGCLSDLCSNLAPSLASIQFIEIIAHFSDTPHSLTRIVFLMLAS